jgi:site-specific DNA recombinase
LGSVRELAEDLDRQGIRTKVRELANGRIIGGGSYGVGALAHLLGNRFYVGEVVYRDDVYRGEHEPIIDRGLFDAVQGRLAAQAVARRCQLRGSPALLTGRIFDKAGNRMTPSHTNKRGARYLYYVSQAVLQKKERPIGSVDRVPAPEIEALVLTTLRTRFSAPDATQQSTESDRDLVERYLERVLLGRYEITVRLRETIVENAPARDADSSTTNQTGSGHRIADATTIVIPWSPPAPAATKGILHVPTHNTPVRAGQREATLVAIAKARAWMEDLANGRVADFAAIARREGKAEKYVRLLVPLAFLSPRILSALLDGTAPPEVTAKSLMRSLPYSWAEQERRIGLPTEPSQAAAGNAARCSSTVSKISSEPASTAALPV